MEGMKTYNFVLEHGWPDGAKAATPLIVTVPQVKFGLKFVPVIVTNVPDAPLVGEKLEIVGSGSGGGGGGVRVDELSHHCWVGGIFQLILPKFIKVLQPLCPPTPGPWLEVPWEALAKFVERHAESPLQIKW
jgi:hypothetical protein